VGNPINLCTNDKRRRLGGSGYRSNDEVCAKVGNGGDGSERSTSEPPQARQSRLSRVEDPSGRKLAGKVSGEESDRVLTPRNIERWAKINHTSQGVVADPARFKERKAEQQPLTSKLGREDCQLKATKGVLTGKVTDIDRSCSLAPRDGSGIKRCQSAPWNTASKPTDPGRSASGWAQPFGTTRADLMRPLVDRMESAKSRDFQPRFTS